MVVNNQQEQLGEPDIMVAHHDASHESQIQHMLMLGEEHKEQIDFYGNA